MSNIIYIYMYISERESNVKLKSTHTHTHPSVVKHVKHLHIGVFLHHILSTVDFKSNDLPDRFTEELQHLSASFMVNNTLRHGAYEAPWRVPGLGSG